MTKGGVALASAAVIGMDRAAGYPRLSSLWVGHPSFARQRELGPGLGLKERHLRFDRDSSFLLTLTAQRPDSLSRMNTRPQRSANLEGSALTHKADAATKSWRGLRIIAVIAGLALTACAASASAGKPQHLTCDSLEHPLGIDSAQPLFAWQLQDDGFGARQTAYRIKVATKPALLSGKPDVWDSGRIASDKSFAVVYGGPELAASTRYYWRVELWNKDGKSYPASDASWWETGLLKEPWKAQWIGYEDAEHRAVRKSGATWITNADSSPQGALAARDTQHDFRFGFELTGQVKHADLFVTGEDSAAAWVNGKQVLKTVPLPPWKQAPWKTYLRQDVTPELRAGQNLLAVGVTLYGTPSANGMGPSQSDQTPMSACLYVEMMDGSTHVWASGKEWRAALDAKQSWYAPEYDDSAWQHAIPYVPPPSPMSTASMGNPWQTGPVKLLRHSFAIGKPVASARLYVTALGAYRFQINGARVGDQVLSPGWDDFRTHVPYQAYDVTQQLKTGQNAIGAWLAPGWYTTPLMWFRQGYNYGDTPPALKAQLRIEHADGSIEWINTDASWRADNSPISQAEIYDGENYDATKEQPGWDTATFSDAGWKPVDLVKPLEPEIVPQSFQPIHPQQILTADAITSPKPGIYIYDFHQNLAGVPRLQVRGPAGTDVQLRFGEVLNPDGTLYVENLRTAKATDHYVLSGKGLEEFQPDFTFHGFRYVEVSGLPAKPDLTAVKAVAIYTNAPITAQLHSGSPMINQLWSNILWGQRSNFVGVPTDCPQRDERLGWTADAQVFWRTASYNMDLTQFSKKFAAGHKRDPGGHADVRDLRSGHGHTESRLRRRLERCGRHHSLDGMAAIRRHARSGAKLGRHGEVSVGNPGGQSGLPMEEGLRNPLRRLAFTGRANARASGGHRLLGLRCHADEADGTRPGQDGR